jgi:hypothetical protein
MALFRWRTLVFAVAAVLVVIAGVVVVRARGGTAQPLGLQPQSVTVDAVDVTITPLALDTSGARFRVALNTHSGSLDADLSHAELRVNGVVAGPGRWDGPGPGGHHREGTLSFAGAVPPGAAVTLRLPGLPGEATRSWTAP